MGCEPGQPAASVRPSTARQPLWHTPFVGISPKQFAEMQRRVGGAGRTARPVLEAESPAPGSRRHAVIMGLDPSLRGTGWGVIRAVRSAVELLGCGVVHCPGGWERTRCLALIAQSLRDAVRKFSPTVCVVEGLFYAQNLQTALIMGEARGAGLAVVAEAGLEVFEIAPRKVKQAIVGYGAAQKLAVAKMVQRMLKLTELPAPDAADALALALTHAQEQGRYSLTPPKKL